MKISAPGKLFLAGEWAVLDVGNPGIVTAVNKRVFAELENNKKIIVSLDDFNIKDIEAEFNGKNLEWKTITF